MQRNTFIFVSVLSVVAALVVGVNIGKSMSATKQAQPSPSLSPSPTPVITKASYTSDLCGISLTYPSNLQILESTTSGTFITDPNKQEDSFIIICQKNIPRVPLTEDNMEERIISNASGSASISATLYHDASEKDGTRIDKLIFYNKYKKLDVFIAGFGSVFDQVIASLQLN